MGFIQIVFLRVFFDVPDDGFPGELKRVVKIKLFKPVCDGRSSLPVVRWRRYLMRSCNEHLPRNVGRTVK